MLAVLQLRSNLRWHRIASPNQGGACVKVVVRVVLAVLGALALVALLVVGFLVVRPVPPVRVHVRNAGPRPIAAIRVVHEHGIETAGGLAPGDDATIAFPSPGESSYALTVRFADGTELGNESVYVEAGYACTETVGESGIETDCDLSGFYRPW